MSGDECVCLLVICWIQFSKTAPFDRQGSTQTDPLAGPLTCSGKVGHSVEAMPSLLGLKQSDDASSIQRRFHARQAI